VISICMNQPERFDEVANLLRPEHFYHEPERTCWRVMVGSDGALMDPLVIKDHLAQTGVSIDGIGGPAALSALMDSVPDMGAIQKYAGIVMEYAERRRMIAEANRLQAAAYKGDFRKAALRAADALNEMAENVGQDETLIPMDALAKEQTAELERRMEHGGMLLGVSTGYTDLNGRFLGWVPGRLYIIAGRPRNGKTTWMLNVARAAANASEKKVVFYSVEMGREELWQRLLLAETGVEWWKLSTGANISDADLKRILKATSDLGAIRDRFLVNEVATDIREIVPQVRRVAKRGDVGLIVVDYLQLLEGGEGKERRLVIGDAARKLKLLAKTAKVPILIAAQLNRTAAGEEGEPGEASLAESDDPFKHADAVMFLDRPKIRRPDSDHRLCELNLIISKNRHGPAGKLAMHFDLDHQRITEASDGVECVNCREGQ
jgi:replicative DNA helicase